MRIVLLTETFSEKVGYMENALSRYLSLCGADVHVISADLHPYYQLKDFHQTYRDFDSGADARKPGSVRRISGFTVHFLGHRRTLGYVRMEGLRKKLREIQPDIVQTSVAVGWLPLDAAMFKSFMGYKLFTGNSTTASVFPLANRPHTLWDSERMRVIVTRTLPGFLISLMADKCFPATVDCAEVATRFLGVPRNTIKVTPLGVDTEIFHPAATAEELEARSRLRAQFGFKDHEIVCIYTGRFTKDKDPLVLAHTIAKLAAAGEPYRGLFVGNGVQVNAIRECAGCVLNPFVPVTELPKYFRAADIGVWPTQESMSMLDAAACGLPIVVNDTLKAVERIDGNGLTYHLGDSDDLARVLLTLRSPEKRAVLGQHGAEKMRTRFSWRSIAQDRIRDYERALKGDCGSDS